MVVYRNNDSRCHGSAVFRRPVLGCVRAQVSGDRDLWHPLRFLLATVLVTSATRAAEPNPYDALQQSFGKYLDPADALAWPAKVNAVAQDEFHFWRGTRDLFYTWAGKNCADWLADKSAYSVSHGDLHLGNIGSFAAGPELGKVAYGLVDFDDSARLPIQLELLQGLVTFELIARDNGISLSDDQRRALRDTLLNTYSRSLKSPPADLGLAKLVKDRTDRPYEVDLKRFTQGERFRTTIEKDGQVTDRLTRLPKSEWPAIARGLAEAVQHDARLSKLLHAYDATDFQSMILDVAKRTRVDSSGSQGLVKLLVLMQKPFRQMGFDGIIYLKQQVPAAAERAGIVPAVEGSPGRRCARDLDALTHGQSLVASWCDIGDKSYWVSIKEPWSDEPDGKKIKSFKALIEAAEIWSRTSADSHRRDASRLIRVLTPACLDDVRTKADACLAWNRQTFEAFSADERTAADQDRWKRSISPN